MVARFLQIALCAACLSQHSAVASDIADGVVAAAMARTKLSVRYDGTYRSIGYPMGDVRSDTGVCTDLVVRAFRSVGIDMQALVHEDMVAAFSKYPALWGLTGPDSNIDHRRVPNLERYFERHGRELGAEELRAGDLVTWRLPGNLPHIGIVSAQSSEDGRRPLIIHNIGRGPEQEDMLDNYPVYGRYRYPRL